jgi:cell division protein FtsL
MSDKPKMALLESNRIIVRIFVGVVVVAAFLLILPLYMQNRLTKLYTKSHELVVEIGLLQRELVLQQLEINKLSSLESLSRFAEEAELGLNGVPVKVRVTGVP